MRRIVLWFMSTLTAVVLLFGYSTSTSGPTAAGGQTAIVSSGDAGASASAEASSTATTITGSVAQTRWGPVQVEITVDGGVITSVAVVEYPTENHKDQEINEAALPILVEETIDAQSADIDMVSGATVTSEGYVESLQAALDEAGL